MRGIAAQLVVLAIVVWALVTIFNNTVSNLRVRGIQTGFDFMDQVAPFAIGFSPFIEYKLGESPYWLVFLIGIQNTIIVSILGIIAATIIGLHVGVMRLSPNFFLSRFALLYIETFRNIPVLLQLMFWNFAVFLPLLPFPQQSLERRRGDYSSTIAASICPSPCPRRASASGRCSRALILGIIAIFVLLRWARRRQYLTGRRPPGVLYGLLVRGAGRPRFSMFDAPLRFERPELGRFNLSGGIQVPLPLFSLWFALSTYTASFIAENVRGGIASVSRGQTEASQSLGLSRAKMLRLVVIPQALRVIIPPTINQYLNLTKNSSLAVAVAYEELVSLWAGIALNQTGQALVIIAMTIVVYETLSLITSAILNIYNKRVQLVER